MNFPMISVLSPDAGDDIAKRVWVALAPGDCQIVSYTEPGPILENLDQTLLIFVDLRSLDEKDLEYLSKQIQLYSYPLEIVGITSSERVSFLDSIARQCDAIIPITDLDGVVSSSRLRKKMRRGRARVDLLTSRRMAEQDLVSATGELAARLEREQEANQIQQQFISMVSHEFRTPLSIIDGNAQLMARHLASGDHLAIEKRTKTIRSAVSRLVQMMEGVLSSDLLRSGKMSLKRSALDLRRLIEDLCEEQRVLSPDNQIETDFVNLPDHVFLDSKLMTQIVTNLLSNAVKYGGGTPVVKVKAEMRGDGVVLIVSDNGVGIPEDEKYRIFDRFYRASTSSGVAGTGIGLSLVREMVRLHGGRIDVSSQVGQGTTFTIYLPASDVVDVSQEKDDREKYGEVDSGN